MGQRLLLLRQPPDREALVIDNPRAGDPGYREHEAFQQRCNRVRELLGEANHAQT